MTFSAAVPLHGLRAREPRRQVFLRASMRAGGPLVDICIRNISSRGMLLQAANPPPRGTYVEVLLAGHVVVARVIWAKDRRFGIHSRDRIDVDAMAGKPASAVTSAQRAVALEPVPRRRPATDMRQRLDKSRRISAMLEFGFFILCGGAAATMAASSLYRLLAGTLETVSGHL